MSSKRKRDRETVGDRIALDIIASRTADASGIAGANVAVPPEELQIIVGALATRAASVNISAHELARLRRIIEGRTR